MAIDFTFEVLARHIGDKIVELKPYLVPCIGDSSVS